MLAEDPEAPLERILGLPELPRPEDCDGACADRLVDELGLARPAVEQWRDEGEPLQWLAWITTVWPPEGQRCGFAVAGYELGWESAFGIPVDMNHRRTVALVIDPDSASGFRVLPGSIGEGDPRLHGTPHVGDHDRDGRPDAMMRVLDGAGVCPGAQWPEGGCMRCGLPSGHSLELRGSGGGLLTGRIPREGRVIDADTERRLAEGLEANGCERVWQGPSDAHPEPCCFELEARWRMLRPVGGVVVRRLEGGGVAVDQVVQRLDCRGWCVDADGEACFLEEANDLYEALPCTVVGTFLESHVHLPESRRVEERRVGDDGAVATISPPADCAAPCAISTRMTRVPDPDPTPHRVRRPALDAARAASATVALPIGWWLVQAGEAVYQVRVSADVDRIVLP